MHLSLSVAVIPALLALHGCWVNERISLSEITTKVATAPYVLPAGVTVLAENEIHEKIIGNTLVGTSAFDDTEIIEYLRYDGSILASTMGKKIRGFWAVSRSLLCLYYPMRLPEILPRRASIYHCYTLVTDADRVSFYDQNGRSAGMKSRLLPGNARGLD